MWVNNAERVASGVNTGTVATRANVDGLVFGLALCCVVAAGCARNPASGARDDHDVPVPIGTVHPTPTPTPIPGPTKEADRESAVQRELQKLELARERIEHERERLEHERKRMQEATDRQKEQTTFILSVIGAVVAVMAALVGVVRHVGNHDKS